MSFYLRLISLALLFSFAIAVDKYYECGMYAIKERDVEAAVKKACKHTDGHKSCFPSTCSKPKTPPTLSDLTPHFHGTGIAWPLKVKSYRRPYPTIYVGVEIPNNKICKLQGVVYEEMGIRMEKCKGPMFIYLLGPVVGGTIV